MTLVPRQIFDVVDLWLRLKIYGEDGRYFLPSGGGLMDQPAALTEALDMLSRLSRALSVSE
jgi:hypothetical protein